MLVSISGWFPSQYVYIDNSSTADLQLIISRDAGVNPAAALQGARGVVMCPIHLLGAVSAFRYTH